MLSSQSLLVVDDDRRLRNLLEKYLSQHGYLVTTAENALEGRQMLTQDTFSLMILDVMMPLESGVAFCRWLRASDHSQKNIPILMLTALGDPTQRLEGLEAGADDYVTKPFEPKELLLRLEKILSRSSHFKSIIFGSFRYDTNNQTLFKNEAPIFLTSTEQSLLDNLSKNPRTPISREELATHSGVSLTPRTVDVQITRLRKKIEDDPRQPHFIRTIRHQGYALWPDTIC